MEPPVFYAPPESVNGDSIILPKEEAHHARNVMRLKEHAQVVVVDGLGTAYRGTLSNSKGRKELIVSVQNTVRNFGEPFVKLTLAAGLSEGNKFDYVVQQGTEVGVSTFVPVITEKSKVKMDNAAKAASRIKRLERVAMSAMKQCRRSYCPVIAPIRKLDDFLNGVDRGALNLIFHPDQSSNRLNPKDNLSEFRAVNLLIGPESGFSDMEVEKAVAAGFKTVTM
ncbi:MAG TPA: RsmE family RNA methyltransferase, partial [candidate division Zixibacteria bacterium]|nr:RsmE family RNA methyltransferase [candidate division Zixibacteria bacterium]